MNNLKTKIEISDIDEGIRPAVEILRKHGFETFESCESGKEHCFPEPTVRFFGDEFDCIRAYETCELNNLNVYEVKRVYRKIQLYEMPQEKKELGEVWDKPFNEIVFIKHSKTGTIVRPC